MTTMTPLFAVGSLVGAWVGCSVGEGVMGAVVGSAVTINDSTAASGRLVGADVRTGVGTT